MKYLSLILSFLAIFLASFLLWDKFSGEDSSVKREEVPLEDPTFLKRDAVSETPAFLNARSWDIPDTLSFAGEKVPIGETHVKEMLDRELHINTYWHNNTIFLIKRARRWLPQMEPILKKHGIPEDFKYLTVIESNLTNSVSPAGAAGFWQFMKGTAGDYDLKISRDVDERYHPIKATEAAALYLKDAYRKLGDWTLVAASYNRGMTGVARALEDQGVDSYYDLYLNSETARYVYRIIAIKQILSHPEKYGFDIRDEHLFYPEEVKYVNVSEDIDNLKNWAKKQGTSYLLLKRHNPWLRNDQLRVGRGDTYEIALPVD